jgi:hypothetical protein
MEIRDMQSLRVAVRMLSEDIKGCYPDVTKGGVNTEYILASREISALASELSKLAGNLLVFVVVKDTR